MTDVGKQGRMSHVLDTSSVAGKGFYSSNWLHNGKELSVLAAGQCGAKNQKYKVVLHAPCNGISMKRTFYADVCKGGGPRVDVRFP